MNQRTVFFISDSTGITAESLGHSLLMQFKQIPFNRVMLPYIDTIEKANAVTKQINKASQNDQIKPLVFSTLINPEIRKIIANTDALLFDIFDTFLPQLEKTLQDTPLKAIGQSHGMLDVKKYDSRMDAVNFALDTDDGLNTKHYQQADLILVGVSRSGKTPTSLYLAMHMGINVANYPLTTEDLKYQKLPDILNPFRSRLFGLIISAQRLHDIREKRYPHSEYASLKQCQQEHKQITQLFKAEKIPALDSTSFSIEEIATKIIAQLNLKQRRY